MSGRGTYGFTFPNGLRVSFTVGHIDRMPKCAHGRVFCRQCESETGLETYLPQGFGTAKRGREAATAPKCVDRHNGTRP